MLLDLFGIFAALVALVVLVALYAVPAIAIAHFGWGHYQPLAPTLPMWSRKPHRKKGRRGHA